MNDPKKKPRHGPGDDSRARSETQHAKSEGFSFEQQDDDTSILSPALPAEQVAVAMELAGPVLGKFGLRDHEAMWDVAIAAWKKIDGRLGFPLELECRRHAVLESAAFRKRERSVVIPAFEALDDERLEVLRDRVTRAAIGTEEAGLDDACFDPLCLPTDDLDERELTVALMLLAQAYHAQDEGMRADA